MAIAKFLINKATSTGPTLTDCGKHPTFLSDDSHTVTTSLFPVAIPLTAGDSPNYSFECVIQWKLTEAPANNVTAMRVYGPNKQPDDPTNKLTIYWGVVDSLSYAAPIQTVSTKATTSQHDNYFSNTDTPKENLDLTVVPGDGKLEVVNELTDFLYMQLKVELDAQIGSFPTQTFTLRYTES